MIVHWEGEAKQDKVRFGGVMGDQRMGDALPMDFSIQDVSDD